jgi:hypothetical protein
MMFHRFLFRSAAILALFWVTGSPGQVHAHHGHGAFHSAGRPGFGRFDCNFNRGFIDLRFRRFDRSFNGRSFDPRFGGFDHGFNRRFFDPHFGGFGARHEVE